MCTVRDIMARNVVTVDPDATLRQIVNILMEHRISGLPVVSRGQVVGVVSATDVLDAVSVGLRGAQQVSDAERACADYEEFWVEEDVAGSYFTDPWPQAEPAEVDRFDELEVGHDLLDECTVAEVMTRALHAVPPSTTLQEAARYMLATGIHRVLVVDDGALVGVVTTTDFMRVIADGIARVEPESPTCALAVVSDAAKPASTDLAAHDAFEVRLSRRSGYEFCVDFGHAGVRPLTVDELPPLGTGNGPNPTRLLGAAVGDCLAASLLFCLGKARISVSALNGVVLGTLARNEAGRMRVGALDVRLNPEVSGADATRMARCLAVFEDFCLVTQSVREGIDVTVSVEPVVRPEPSAEPVAVLAAADTGWTGVNGRRTGNGAR